MLLAEDNRLNQEVAVSLLEDIGLQVDVAGDGLIALERAAAVQYDLILLDVQMPRMDGLAAARQLRQMPGYTRTPIVAMTANAFEEDRQVALAAGMDEHVAKPVDPDVLYAILHRLLGGSPRPPTDSAALTLSDDILASIDGLDLVAGMRSALGNRELFVELLELFADTHGDDIEKTRHALHSGDFKSARLAVHSLKGTSATLGFTALSRYAASVEKAIAADAPVTTIIPDLDRLDSWLEGILRQLRNIVSHAEIEACNSATVDVAQLASDLAALRHLLAADDLTATDAFTALESRLSAFAGRSVARLQLEIDDYDFATALQTLDAIVEAQPVLRETFNPKPDLS